jgi:hypothetical protein
MRYELRVRSSRERKDPALRPSLHRARVRLHPGSPKSKDPDCPGWKRERHKLEHARDARARAWIYVFECVQKRQKAAEPAGRNNASIRNSKEVSDVNQRPDRPSEFTYQAAP